MPCLPPLLTMFTYFTQVELVVPLVLLVNIGALNVTILDLFQCMFDVLHTGTIALTPLNPP